MGCKVLNINGANYEQNNVENQLICICRSVSREPPGFLHYFDFLHYFVYIYIYIIVCFLDLNNYCSRVYILIKFDTICQLPKMKIMKKSHYYCQAECKGTVLLECTSCYSVQLEHTTLQTDYSPSSWV